MNEMVEIMPDEAGVRVGAIRMSKEVDKILPALLKAQKAMEHAHKDGENPHFKSRYTSLTSVLDAGTSALNQFDLMLVPLPNPIRLAVRVC